HRAGQGPNKPHGVQDFGACAAWLIAHGYTSAGRLSATGASMGGVLIGRAITERPELYAAAAIQAGIVNALRYLQAENGANQSAELIDDGGESGFRTLLAMDACQNVRPGVAYPAVLLMVGLNDQRVSPWMSAKFGARLQAVSRGERPVLIRVDGDSGH